MHMHAPVRLGLLAAAAVMTACGGATGPDGPGAAALISAAVPTSQTAGVATLLSPPLSVTVTDAKGRGVPGVTVNWAVTAGNGVVAPTTSLTDAKGVAPTSFSVGATAGTNTVTANVTGVATTVTFTIIGSAGPLSQVVAGTHSLVLGCGLDTGHVSANPADQYGNPVAGTVTWVSRNPSVATVDASGAVHLLAANGSTYLVATSGAANADSVLVQGATLIALAASGVSTNIPGGTFCVQSSQAGSEFSLIAFYSSTAQGNAVGLTVSGSGLGTVGSGANVVPSQLAAPSFSLQPPTTVHPDYAFEHALRERERREMPQYVAGARAWYTRMQQQWSANPTAAARAVASAAGVAGPPPLAQQITSSAKVGDLVQLNVNANAYCTSPIMTTARIAAISNTAIIVSDTTNPAGGFTDTEYGAFATAMDTLVMPVDTAAFGTPSDIDHNGRVVILFTKAVNALTTDPSQGIVLGFYYSRDLLPATGPLGACPGSNQSEMFYLLVPDPSGSLAFTQKKANVSNVVVGTIGHEFQHLINASRRMYINNAPVATEETWLNEGLSHIAEELIFYRASGLAPRQNIGLVALSDPNVYNAFGLYMWGNQGRYQTFLPVTQTHGPIGEYADDDELPTRAATWTFLRFMADHRPADNTFFYRLVNSQTSGLANIQSVIGGDPMPLMRQWATSVFTDGTVTGIDPAYTQLSWNWPQVYALTRSSYKNPVSHTLTTAVPVSVTLNSDGTAYFPFAVSNGGQGLVTVTGPGGTPLPAGVQLTVVRTK